MALFLSGGMLERVQERLLAGGYAPDTPAALVYKATWPDERCVRCTVGTLARAGRDAMIDRTALVLVGRFLDAPYEKSRLYDPAFTTGYREGRA
jgi:precorrin-4/cobalt-precorrin-4 C11-methyltransferase